MNDLSNEIHSIEKDIETFFKKELAKLESGAVTLLSDLKVVLNETVDAAGPVVQAAAAAAVTAALGTTTGGLGAIAAAAKSAGLALLEKQGVSLAEKALQEFETLVLGNVLKTVRAPAGTATGN